MRGMSLRGQKRTSQGRGVQKVANIRETSGSSEHVVYNTLSVQDSVVRFFRDRGRERFKI